MHIDIDKSSTLSVKEAEAIIGKTVASVLASEYSVTIKFTDGTEISAQGQMYEGNPLDVDVTTPHSPTPAVEPPAVSTPSPLTD